MDYREALKKLQTAKPRDNYMLIKLSYETSLVLPHKDGLAFLGALNAAEQFNDPYNKPHTISELERSKIVVSPMSYIEYERYKIAAILNISVDEVIQQGLAIQ